MSEPSFVAAELAWPPAAECVPEWQTQVRRRLLALIGTPPFATQPALEPRVLYTSDDGGWWRHKVRYGNEADDAVWAWLLEPKGLEAPAPAVICLPGSFMTPNWGRDGPTGLAGPWTAGDPEAYGADLARLGYVVLCPDYPCCGERTAPGCRSHDTTQLDARFPSWTRVGLSAWDVRRAVDFLGQRHEVDQRRIAVYGWSQGGQMAIIGAALDERIAAVVSVCGWGPLRGVGGSRARNWVQSYNFPRLAPHLAAAQPLPVDFDHLVACVAPRPLLDVRAVADDTFANGDAEGAALRALARLWRQLHVPERWRAVSAPGPHAHGAVAARESQAWLHRWLWDAAGPMLPTHSNRGDET